MWTKINSAASGATTYDLYAANLDAAAPFNNWFIERTVQTAAFVSDGKTVTHASWSTNSGKNSDQAWADRATLAYSSNLLIPSYPGDSGLKISSTSAGGGGAMALTQELPAVSLTKGVWTKVSDNMVSGKSYHLILSENESGWAVPAASQPSSSQDGQVGIPIGDVGFAWSGTTPPIKFNATPIWAWTSFGSNTAPARVQILEVE